MFKIPTCIHNRLRFVLVETSRPGNVGAAARAIKTMGFDTLTLVRPRYPDVLEHEEAIAFASGAQDVLASARIVDTLAEAVAGCSLVAALTSRRREFSPPVATPRMLGRRIYDDKLVHAALVFGSERYGLSNEDVMQAQCLIHIPANPLYSSLNLAQAVQLLAYECSPYLHEQEEQFGKNATRVPDGQWVSTGQNAAAAEDMEGMFQHLEQALTELEFLDPDNPGKLMPRIRRLFSRTSLEKEEVNILRGIAGQIILRRARLHKRP